MYFEDEIGHASSGDIHENDIDEDLLRLHDPKYVDSLSREKCEEHIQNVAKKGYHELLQPLLRRCVKVPNSVLINLLANAEERADRNVDYQKCLNYVLSEGVQCDVNRPDSGLDTPLHYSVKYADSDTTLCLLQKGASLGNVNRFGVLPVEEIDARTLEKHFDSAIEAKSAGINKIVVFNYRTIIPTLHINTLNYVKESDIFISNTSNVVFESAVLNSMTKIPDLWPLLAHPLITSYLFIKWYKIRKFFYIHLILYMIYYASLLTFIFLSYHGDTKRDFYALSFIIPAVPIVISSVTELLQIFSGPRNYFLHFENLLQLLLAALSLIIVFEESPTSQVVSSLSASAILLGAFKLLILLGRHPLMSTNLAMFHKVARNFFKSFICYTILILAFALTFYKLNDVTESEAVILRDEAKSSFMFSKFYLTVIKTIVMLSGELDASTVNFDVAANTVVFVLFIFLMPLILLNLLIGIAVCDTALLKTNSQVVGILKRIEYLVYLEGLMLGNISHRMQGCLSKLFCVSNDFLTDYKLEVYINNNGKIRNRKRSSPRNMYLDRNTIKQVKLLLEERRQCDKTDEINRLESIISEKEELINNLTCRLNGQNVENY